MRIESLDDVIDAVHKSTEDRSKLLKIKPKNMLIKPCQLQTMRIKIAAVAAISFFDNMIDQQIVEVEEGATWKDAFLAAMKKGLFGERGDQSMDDWISEMPDDLCEARTLFAGGEMDICVTFNHVELVED